ncbi:MAG: WbqC family protein [Patescibacteria group bacterium]
MTEIQGEGVSVHIRQPAYLPGIVYFDQLLKADTHVVYDNVQYERRHWGNRNKILNTSTPEGWQWLTVPTIQKGKRDQWYQDTKIDNTKNWALTHWKAISTNYSHAPFFKLYSDFFEDLYTKHHWDNLVDLDMHIINYLKAQLGINTEIVLSSTLQVGTNFADKNQRLIEIVKELGGTTYVTVKGTNGYIDSDDFEKERIELLWHQFSHPTYPQFQGGFIPGLSVVDLLFNCGPASESTMKENTQAPTTKPF